MEIKLEKVYWSTICLCSTRMFKRLTISFDSAVSFLGIYLKNCRLKYMHICCRCLVAKLCLTLLQPHGLQLARLLCPRDFPGKNTGVDCHFLLQGNFPTPGVNPCLLLGRQIITEPPGKLLYGNYLGYSTNYKYIFSKWLPQ